MWMEKVMQILGQHMRVPNNKEKKTVMWDKNNNKKSIDERPILTLFIWVV